MRTLVPLLCLTMAFAARAQSSRYTTHDASSDRSSDAGDITRDDWPAAVLRRPLTLAQGLGQITIPVTMNFSTGQVGKPVYIPAILAYGVTDALTVSITHQTGLCVTGSSNGCPNFYNDIGLQAMYAVAPRGPLQMAGVVGVQAASFTSPFATAVIVGFDSRLTSGMLAVRLDPRLAIGMSGRDNLSAASLPVPVALDFHGAPIIGGNRETLFIPLALQAQASDQVAVTLGSGVAMQLDPILGSVGDNTSIPIGLSVAYTMPRYDLGLSFGFPNLKAPAGAGAFDQRVGQVFATVRL